MINSAYFLLVEVGDEGFTDCLCLRLQNVLVEVDHSACHATFLVRTEVDAVAFNNILAVRIDDVDDSQIIGCPLYSKPTKAMLLAGTIVVHAQQVVPCFLLKHSLFV